MEFESAKRVIKNASIEEVKLLLGTKMKIAESKENTFEVKLRVPIYLRYGGIHFHDVFTRIHYKTTNKGVLLIANSQLNLPFKLASGFSIFIGLLFFPNINFGIAFILMTASFLFVYLRITAKIKKRAEELLVELVKNIN